MKKLLSLLIILLITVTTGFCEDNPASSSTESIAETGQNRPVVYFTRTVSPESLIEIYEKLEFKPGEKLGVKVHFGEKGNRNFIRPAIMKKLVTMLNGTFVETNTLYTSPRSKTESHIALAREHGWDYAPIHILGSSGETAIPSIGRYFKEILVGKDMDLFDSFLVISHFKGHKMNGIGGAIKNLAMGFAVPSGKKAQHQRQIPVIDEEKCVQCGLCVSTCPAKAISDSIEIDRDKCIGCGQCVAICPKSAIISSTASSKGAQFQEKLAEYAASIHMKYHMTYINFLTNISPACDCVANAPAAFCKDIGILASQDPVALDRACYDLVNKSCGKPDAFEFHSGVSGLPGLIHAEKLGAGTGNYKLIEF